MTRKQRRLARPKRKTKAGRNKSAVVERREAFIAAYLSNGHNCTQAAIAAGFSPRTAYSQGQRLLKNVEVERQLAEAAKKAGDAADLKTERTLQEVRRVAFSDPRRFFRNDGSIKPPVEWDADMAAAVASYEVVGTKTKLKFCDKLAALEQAMRHLGLYERDNRHNAQNLAIQVNLVGPTTPLELQAKRVP